MYDKTCYIYNKNTTRNQHSSNLLNISEAASSNIVFDNIWKPKNSIKLWLMDMVSVMQECKHKNVLTIFIIA